MFNRPPSLALKALPGKLHIKSHSPSILYITSLFYNEMMCLTLFILFDYSMHIDTISMELSVLYSLFGKVPVYLYPEC